LDSELVESARQLKLACAVTSKNERIKSGDDTFCWGRFHVGQNDTAAMIGAKLSGWYPMLASAARSLAPRLAWAPSAIRVCAPMDQLKCDESQPVAALAGEAKSH
jgi:hypothetical protein